MDELVDGQGAYCLAKEEELYLIYLPEGSAKVQLMQSAPLNVSWFNPRTGGEMQEGSVSSISGPGYQSLGTPPSDPDKDWVVVIQLD